MEVLFFLPHIDITTTSPRPPNNALKENEKNQNAFMNMNKNLLSLSPCLFEWKMNSDNQLDVLTQR